MGSRNLKRLAGRAGLYFVTASLLISGVLRILGGAGEALAEAGVGADEMAAKPAAHSLPPTLMANDYDPNGLATLAETLRERETRVEMREQALQERFAEISVAEQVLADNLNALEMAEQRLAKTLTRADGAMDEDLMQLTKVYETMKPKDAAVLFETMDPKFAAGFLARMSPNAASGVMAGLSPETAYAISLIFAGRHFDVPEK